MAVIGVIDIAMKANTEGFTKGIATASRSLSAFVGKTASAGVGAIGDGLSAVGAKATQLGSSLAGAGAQILKLGAVAGVAAAVGLAGLATASLQSIDATGDLAEKLGVSGGEMAAFSHAVKLTGGPVEALPEILGKLNGTLGLAAQNAGPAGAAIRQLGLDAKTLAKAGPIEATKAIAEGLSKIENPAARAAVATQIFGEQGAKLAGTFKAGSAGIQALEEDAKKLGLALADADYAKVAAANDALDRAGAAVTGVGNQLAVALSPYIEAAANAFVDLATAGGGVGPIVSTALEWVGSGVGIVADVVHTAKLGFLLFQAAGTKAAAFVVDGISMLGKGIESLINLIPGMNVSFTGTLDAMSADLHKLAGEELKGFGDALAMEPPSTGIKSFFDDIKSSAQASADAVVGTKKAVGDLGAELGNTTAKVAELETKLQEQIATFGMSSAEVEVYKLKQQGAGAADLDRVSKLTAQLKVLDDNKKASEDFAKEATKVFEETRTPLEKFAMEGTKIKAMFDQGLIDEDTLGRGLEKLKKDSGVGEDTGKKAGAVDFGSKEARSSILAFRSGSSGDPAGATSKNTERAAKTLDLLLAETRRNRPKATEVVEI